MDTKKKGKDLKKMIIAEELATITMALERITQALTDDEFVREAELLDAECNRQRDRHHRRHHHDRRGRGRGRGSGDHRGRNHQVDQPLDDNNAQQREITDDNPEN